MLMRLSGPRALVRNATSSAIGPRNAELPGTCPCLAANIAPGWRTSSLRGFTLYVVGNALLLFATREFLLPRFAAAGAPWGASGAVDHFRFRLYEEGPVVKQRFGVTVVKDRDKSGVERSSSLYRLLFEGPGVIGARPGGAIPKRAVYAARRKPAPAGAKGSLRVSMCQIAVVSLRARSTCATLAPRWRPSCFFLRS
jgi:hypothetical protein